MKFSVVEMGQRFNFKGAVYVKSGPLVANHETTGETKFFRRADNVQPVGAETVVEKQPTTTLSVDDVMQYFEQFYSECIEALDENLSSDLADEKNALFGALESAKGRFLKKCSESG